MINIPSNIKGSAIKYTKDIIEMYQNGIGSTTIAKKLNIGETSVLRILKNNNICKRELSESMKKYSIDTTYFDNINTPNKAYILGFWYADGVNYTPQHLLKLSLQIDDLEILEKIKQELKMEKPILISKQYGKGKKDIASIQIYDIHMSKRFEELGCPNNKSLILKFPDFISDELMPHFIRGYFDGDGYIKDPDKGKGSRITFVSSILFIQELSNYITNNFNIKNTIRIMKNPKTASLEITRQDNVKIIADWMYKDAELYMKRKYNKYIKKFYPELLQHNI